MRERVHDTLKDHRNDLFALLSTYVAQGKGILQPHHLLDEYDKLIRTEKDKEKLADGPFLEILKLALVGSYHASSLLVASRPPTRGILSRGIGLEGLCSVLAGLWGTSTGLKASHPGHPSVPVSNIISDHCRKHVAKMKHCRVDTSYALNSSPWFRFPYPLQWACLFSTGKWLL